MLPKELKGETLVKSKAKQKTNTDVSKHVLVPPHQKLDEKEKKELLEKYGITVKELPAILITDSAISHLGAKVGDVIKITRKNKILGEDMFYRGVVNEL